MQKVTITDLRKLISKSTSIPEDEQRLLTSDHVILEDFWVNPYKHVSQKRLKCYPQISDESVIHLVRLTRRMMKIFLSNDYNGPKFYVDIPKV